MFFRMKFDKEMSEVHQEMMEARTSFYWMLENRMNMKKVICQELFVFLYKRQNSR